MYATVVTAGSCAITENAFISQPQTVFSIMKVLCCGFFISFPKTLELF